MFSRLRSGKIFKEVDNITIDNIDNSSDIQIETSDNIIEINSDSNIETNTNNQFESNSNTSFYENCEESSFSDNSIDYSFETNFLGYYFLPNMPLDEKFALNMIPEFDGSNVSELDRFISCCEYVKDGLSNEDIKKLLKLLHRKLLGKAHDVLVYNDFENFDDFKNEMISQFAPSKSKEVIELELLNIKQENSEDIRKYSNRIEQLLSLLNSSCTVGQTKEVAKAVRKLNERTALKAFEVGLKDPIRTIVLASRYETLKDSVTGAIEHESLFTQKQIATQNNTVRQNQSQIKCNFCHKIGHISKNCFSRNLNNSSRFKLNPSDDSKFSNRNQNYPSNHQNFTDKKVKFCNYCKFMGHVMEECRKRQKNNSRNNSNNPSASSSINNIQQSENNQAPESSQMNTAIRVRDLI